MVVVAFGSSSAIPSVIELHCFPTNYYVYDCAESFGSPTASLKSSVAQMEKMLLEDKELLHSLEANAEEPDSAPTR
nr:hypothetical protein Iba_chr10dCG12130 [Ipomoea batatas]